MNFIVLMRRVLLLFFDAAAVVAMICFKAQPRTFDFQSNGNVETQMFTRIAESHRSMKRSILTNVSQYAFR